MIKKKFEKKCWIVKVAWSYWATYESQNFGGGTLKIATVKTYRFWQTNSLHGAIEPA